MPFGPQRAPAVCSKPKHDDLRRHEGRTTVRLQGATLKAAELEWKTFEVRDNSMQQGFKETVEELNDSIAGTTEGKSI